MWKIAPLLVYKGTPATHTHLRTPAPCTTGSDTSTHTYMPTSSTQQPRSDICRAYGTISLLLLSNSMFRELCMAKPSRLWLCGHKLDRNRVHTVSLVSWSRETFSLKHLHMAHAVVSSLRLESVKDFRGMLSMPVPHTHPGPHVCLCFKQRGMQQSKRWMHTRWHTHDDRDSYRHSCTGLS